MYFMAFFRPSWNSPKDSAIWVRRFLMADREQPFGEGNGRNSCNLSPLHIDLKSKKGRIVANPNVRLRKELPDALAGHLHPVGGSATLNFPPI